MRRVLIAIVAVFGFVRLSRAPMVPAGRHDAVTPVAVPETVRAPEITRETGTKRRFRPGVVLAKFKGRSPCVISVNAGGEREALDVLQKDPGVEFAELDFVLTRQFAPSDPKIGEQWHHRKIGSSNAWAISLGAGQFASNAVTIAILDTPFQMNHPDLQANSVVGWSMIRRAPNLFETNGYYHSTIAAGIAGAVVNNGTGVSGMVNCVLTPVDIGDQPTTSDMYNAVVWAADQGIRVVNLSWDGAFSATLNEAGTYLKEKARGMLFMSGVNGRRQLNYAAHPDIYAVAMTDENDQPRSSYGNHIDFAAPGWEVFSTTTNSSYEIDSGTSYSSPLMAGIAAWIMSAAPELDPPEIEEVLRASCVDLGPVGWDQDFGWGRIDFASVARETFGRTRISRIAARRPRTIEAVFEPGTEYQLFRSANLHPGSWEAVPAVEQMLDGRLFLRDPVEGEGNAFYKLQITRPR